MTPANIIHFWMNEVGRRRWFRSNASLDAEISQRFGDTYLQARDGELADWENSSEGALALVLLLDQFPRNMFRGSAEAFATDTLARGIADRAIARGFDRQVPRGLRAFLYMPFMHSENLHDQDRCVRLIGAGFGKFSSNYPFALGHRRTIAKFGRFPHRNAALGRESTAEEVNFLRKGGSRL